METLAPFSLLIALNVLQCNVGDDSWLCSLWGSSWGIQNSLSLSLGACPANIASRLPLIRGFPLFMRSSPFSLQWGNFLMLSGLFSWNLLRDCFPLFTGLPLILGGDLDWLRISCLEISFLPFWGSLLSCSCSLFLLYCSSLGRGKRER